MHLNDQQVGTLSEGEDLWSFDLAPGLPRSKQLHQDGGLQRKLLVVYRDKELYEPVKTCPKITRSICFAISFYSIESFKQA